MPVSLQGTAKIDTSSALPVNVQGQVKLDTSSPIPVRDVDRSTQEPVQFELFNPGPNSYTVPAGKRLVIEYVSGAFAIPPAGGLAELSLNVSPGISHVLPGTPTSYDTGAPSGLGFGFSHSVKIYAGPGAHVSFSGGMPNVGNNVHVSGYLVDAL